MREKAILRSLISTATEIATRGYEEQGSVEEFLDSAEKSSSISPKKKIKASFVAVGDMITDTLKTIDKLYQRKEMVTGVPTGYEDLDKITAGLATRGAHHCRRSPRHGQNRIRSQYRGQRRLHRRRRSYFSLEMAKEQLVLRMLCSEARVNSSKVRSGYLGERDFPQLRQGRRDDSTRRRFISTIRRQFRFWNCAPRRVVCCATGPRKSA